jgi:hypothetical protein
VTGGWRKLHNEELHDLIKIRRKKWAGHVDGKSLKARDHSEDQGIDMRTILKWLFDK